MKYLLITFLFCSSVLAGERVAIIDTGLDIHDPRFSGHLCKNASKDFTGEGITDVHGHGTHIAGLIQQYAGKANYCIIVLKFWSTKISDHDSNDNMIKAMKEAARQKATVINISAGGESFSEDEYNLIRYNKRATFITAAGNKGVNIDYGTNKFYPASYQLKNIIVVGNLNKEGTKSKTSNFGTKVTNWEVGDHIFFNSSV
jgi:major intracellular serine protease